MKSSETEATPSFTSKLTTSKLTTSKLTTSKPTTSKPTTSKPTTSKPTTSKPTTSKPSSSKPTTVIIGYGSPIRGDDAIGPLVADRLMDQLESSEVGVHSRHVLTAELVEDLENADVVIFLDAAMDGPVGQVCCRRLIPATTAASSMAHFLSPDELLGWLDQLYHRRPNAYLLSVRGVSFDFANYELSPAAAAAVEPMIESVRELLRR